RDGSIVGSEFCDSYNDGFRRRRNCVKGEFEIEKRHGRYELCTFYSKVDHFLIHKHEGRQHLLVYAEWNLSKDTSTDQFGNTRFRRLGGLEYSVASCIVGLVGFLSVGRYKWVLECLDYGVEEFGDEMGAREKDDDSDNEGNAL